MPRIVHPMVYILEDIKQVALRYPLFEEGFDRLEVLGRGLSWQTFEMWRSLMVNGQRSVLRVRRIHTTRHFTQTCTQLRHETCRCGRKLERLAVDRETGDASSHGTSCCR